MKKTTKELLDDLLGDDAPAEIEAALLDKTLRSARRRKRVRRFNMALSMLAVAGICVVSFWKTREPGVLPMEMQQADAMATSAQVGQLLQRGQVIATRSGSVKEFVSSAPGFAEVVTTGVSGRYQVIDDQPAFAQNKTPIPDRQKRVAQTVTVKKWGEGTVVSQIAFRPKKPVLELRPGIRHLQCATARASQPPKKHKQNKGAIDSAADGNDEG